MQFHARSSMSAGATVSSTDWVGMSFGGVFGLGLSLWVTSLWRIAIARGTAVDENGPFKKLVFFLLVGAVPSVISGVASSNAGTATFASYVGGVGIGFIVGWVFTQGHGSVNAGAARRQYGLVGTAPSNLEVFSLAAVYGVGRARAITGLDDQVFTRAFEQGADEAQLFLRGASEHQRAIFTRAFAGDPISAIARDLGKTPAQTAQEFSEIITRKRT